MNKELARIAREEAERFFHGNCMGSPTNLKVIADHFPYTATWTLDSWDGVWCGAFVYYCVHKSGYPLPSIVETEGKRLNLAACCYWDEWSHLPSVNAFHGPDETPEVGDIVLWQKVFDGKSPDHIGIVTEVGKDWLENAEGNFNNVSAIVRRPYSCVYGYVRLEA